MSKENVDIVRESYQAYQRGDVARGIADIDPELVVHRAEPDGATFRGPEGLLKAFAEWVEDFDEFSVTAEEFIDANDRQVVVRVHQKAVGARSGVPIEADYWFVHTLKDSKLIRLDMLPTRDRAFEAAGLSE
jgi:ketosteroid isomerase-like protein